MTLKDLSNSIRNYLARPVVSPIPSRPIDTFNNELQKSRQTIAQGKQIRPSYTLAQRYASSAPARAWEQLKTGNSNPIAQGIHDLPLSTKVLANQIPSAVNSMVMNPQQFGQFARQTPQYSKLNVPGLQTLANFSANSGQLYGQGTQNVGLGIYRTKKSKGLLNKAAGVAQTVTGAGQIAAPFVPGVGQYLQGANLAASLPQSNNQILNTGQRFSAGFVQGVGLDPTLASNVQKRESIKFNLLGNEIGIDPAMTAGSMIGFIKNPVNRQLFKLTEAVLPARSLLSKGNLTKWLSITAARGGLEDIFLSLGQLPENVSTADKLKFMGTNFATGAATELGGRSMSEVGGKVLNTAMDSKLAIKAFDELKVIGKKLTVPVKTGIMDEKTGKYIVEPMYKQWIKHKMKDQGGFIKPDEFIPKKANDANGSLYDITKVGNIGQQRPLEGILQRKQNDLLSSQKAQSTQPLRSQIPQKQVQNKIVNQPSEDIIQQAYKEIGSTPNKPERSFKQAYDDFYTQWVDRYNPLVKASQKAKSFLKIKNAELRPENDPEVLVRRLTGATGIADYRYKAELDPIIKQAEKLGIGKLDLDAYLINKRKAGFGKVGRDIYGSDPKQASQVVSALEAKYGENIKGISDQLYTYQDKGFQEMIDAGFISKDSGVTIKSQNPDYAPLNRVMDQIDNYLGLPTRKTMQGSQPIAKIKGSKKQIESPVESIIGNTFKQRAAIEKNRVAQSLVNLQKIDKSMGFKKVSKSGSDTITVWNNGDKEYWQVGQDIAETAKGVNEETMNLVLKVLQKPASLLRQGATGRNPEFMLPNILRDQLDAGITSEYGYIPFVDYVSGLKSMLTDDTIYKSWQTSGAKIDLGELSGKKEIKQLFNEKTAKKNLAQWLGSGLIKTLDFMGKYSEQPTRVGLFKKAYNKTGNELLAAVESRDATVDFARMGSKMKTANSIINFLNVGIQGFDKLIRAVKNNPAKVTLNMGIYGATPAIGVTMYNLIYHPDEYRRIPDYEKDANFVLVKGKNLDGTVDYVTFPKGNIIPIVANPIQSFLEFAYGNNQQSFKEMALNTVSNILPVVGQGSSFKEIGVKTVGQNLPQAFKPLTENLLNKSFYRYDPKSQISKDIVPYFLQNKPAYQQDYDFTPVMYKKIGAAFNVSPLQVKNLMEGYLAGYTKIPAEIIQTLTKISRNEQVSPNDIPIARRFVKQTYSSSSDTKTKEEVKVPSFMDRITGKASAAETTPTDITLPTEDKKIEEVYKEAIKNTKGYQSKLAQIDAGISSSDKSVVRTNFVRSANIKKEIENKYPEKVFQYELDTYKSGGSANVEERSKWVFDQLSAAQNKEEVQSLVTKMDEGKVLTKSVLKVLYDEYDIDLYGKTKDIVKKSTKAKKIKISTSKATVKIAKIPQAKRRSLSSFKIAQVPKSPSIRRIKNTSRSKSNPFNSNSNPFKIAQIKTSKLQGLTAGRRLV